MIDLQLVVAAGIATGTILLFAAVGEILAERSGVLNLGVEGMMLIGAVVGYATAVSVGDPWLGVALAMLAGGLLSLLHAVITIHFRADQVVSGLALTFLGTGLARVLGEGLSKAGAISLLPRLTIPVLSDIPVLGPIAFTDQSILVYVGYLLVPATWYWINRTRPGLHLRAVGEEPAAADALGVSVYWTRYRYVFVGGLLAGLAGATITLAVQPGWFGDLTVNKRGWIAIGLVIFAQWSPFRAAFGAYLFGAIVQLTLSMQLPPTILGFPNPFFEYHPNTFFLEMLPYALVLVALVLGSRGAMRKRIGAPAALGIPYVRGERGR
ncbi:MAG TPA: ABC transporter permease [Candidatus Limnocylindrales bacterium]|nr:ABC transporter permease [Candidatus Limnocylindrales bacterium]